MVEYYQFAYKPTEVLVQKFTWSVFIVGLLIWIGHFSENPGTSVTPPIPVSVSAPIKAVLELLGLGFKINAANAKDGCFDVPKSKITTNGASFCPEDFARKNGIRTNIDVENYDKKAQRHVDECTKEVIKKGIFNEIAMYEARASCLARVGYSPNDRAYLAAKIYS